jgi:hypothetical protein
MATITWCAPVLPGKLEQWNDFMSTIKGSRADEHRASRERHGITREVVSLMATPMGDLVCLLHEGPGIPGAFQQIAASKDPYDVWFTENIMQVHGLTAEMLAGPLPTTLHMDFRADAGVPTPRTVDVTQKERVR